MDTGKYKTKIKSFRKLCAKKIHLFCETAHSFPSSRKSRSRKKGG